MNALANINVQDFKQRVQDHVLNTFGSLIPQEQFEQMVNAEIKSFFEGKTEIQITKVESSYSSGRVEALKTNLTPFRAVVYAAVLKMVGSQLDTFFTSEHAPVKKMIQELIEIPELQEAQVSEAQRLMMAMAGMMFKNVMENANLQATYSLAQAFRNRNMWDIADIVMTAPNVYAPAANPEIKP